MQEKANKEIENKENEKKENVENEVEEIKTEFTEEELIAMYGEAPEIPEEIPTRPEKHEEGENE